MKRIAAVAVSLACLVASRAIAQPVIDRVPQDAVAYFGWAGANTLADAYGPSHLKAVLDETRVRDLFGKYLDDVIAKIVKQDPKAQEPLRLMRAIGTPMWKYPTAVFVGKPDLADVDHPKFFLAFITQAGAESATLADELNAIVAKAPKGGPPIKAFASGDFVCYAIGSETPESMLGSEGSALGKSASFAAALKQVSARPVVISYVNAEAIIAMGDEVLAAKQPEAHEKAKAFLDNSGLRGVKAYISTAGFDGKDWVEQSLLSVPGERGGLFAARPAGPIDPALLKAVPADATFLVTTRFDAAKFVRAMRDALGKTDEQALQYFNMGLSGMQQALGTNVVDNLLEPLGSDWAIYSSPRTGAGLLGMVAVNKLDDPEKMRKGLNTASVNLTNWINVALRKNTGSNGVTVSVHGATTKIGDVDVNYIALPLFAPSWAIADGKLFVGPYTQVVGAAARQAAKAGASITDSPKYKALLTRLGNNAPESSSYYDLPTSASYGSMYPQIMVLARYAGFGDLFGLTLPEPLLPPIDVLLDHLAPAGSISWSDATGYHTKSVTPFPGASLVSEQGAIASVGVGSGAMVASVLLPSLNRARETANRVKSASNLRQIGTAMMLYANENRGKYPADIGELIETQDLPVQVFDNPRADDTEPPLPNGQDLQALGTYVNENSDYVYLGAGKNNSSPAEEVLAYENPEGLDDGINILFGDGHVEFLQMGPALQIIDKAKQ